MADSLDESIPYDLALVTLSAHRVAPLVGSLQRSASAAILFLFNIFEPEQLRDTIGADRSFFGMPFIQGRIGEGGELNATIGDGGQKTKISDERWLRLLTPPGFLQFWSGKCFYGCGATFRSA